MKTWTQKFGLSPEVTLGAAVQEPVSVGGVFALMSLKHQHLVLTKDWQQGSVCTVSALH